jgi:hypothetical protein
MIVDTSAVLAILFNESGAWSLTQASRWPAYRASGSLSFLVESGSLENDYKSFGASRTSAGRIPPSGEKPILQHAPESSRDVPQTDLFAFFIGATKIGDWNFKNSPLPARHLGGDLRLKSEPLFLKFDLL